MDSGWTHEMLNGSMADAVFITTHWHLIPGTEDDPRSTCDRFDPVTRRCLAYDERPPVCVNYPFYDGLNDRPDHPSCSFWADVPEAEWPPEVRVEMSARR